MQAQILTVSPSLMQWMILKIDLYKLVCYTDIHHYFYIYMHIYMLIVKNVFTKYSI